MTICEPSWTGNPTNLKVTTFWSLLHRVWLPLKPQEYESSWNAVHLLSQDFICEHYGEDSSLYDQEIKELTELRQVSKWTHKAQSFVLF